MKKILLAFIFLFLGVHTAWSTLHMSVLPADGSRSLRFDRLTNIVEQKKDVRIRISATDSQRYQVFQRVLEPIVNEKGQSLNLQAIKVASSLGSNAAGTLYLMSPETMFLSDTLVYSSSQSGDVDSFVLGYVVDSSLLNAEGRFFGKILYTLRPLSGGVQKQEILDIVIEAQSNFKTSITGSRHLEAIQVKDTDRNQKSGDFVKINISGNKGDEIKIYQDLISSLQHEELLKDIGSNSLEFVVDADTHLSDYTQGNQKLSRSNVLLYKGRAKEVNMGVHFFANFEEIFKEKSGIYRGKLQYTIETSQGREQKTLDISLEVQPVFSLDIPLLSSTLRFDDIQYGQPPVFREIILKVASNLEKPYQIVQDFQAPLTNEKGQILEENCFMMKVDLMPGQKGKVKTADFVPLKVGSVPVFMSDRKGSPTELRVIYRLEGYSQMPSGGFSAPIRFSLNQN